METRTINPILKNVLELGPVLAFFGFIIWALTQQTDTLQALLVTPVWFIVLGVAWRLVGKAPHHIEKYAAFQRDLEEEAKLEAATRA